MPEDVLDQAAPAADVRLAYGSDPNQFGDLRLPKGKGPFAVVMNIHGGFWRAKYDLQHAGHACAALTSKGVATFNLEYRRVGNAGGGWPGTFEDIVRGYRFLPQIAKRYNLDVPKTVVTGHSAGGQLALCLAGHEKEIKGVVSLGGAVDLQEVYQQHLSHDAVVEFLGGTPKQVPDHYKEADPMVLSVAATQWLIHGLKDEDVPPFLSRNYVQTKKAKGEDVHLLEIGTAAHMDLIDPTSAAWPKVEQTVMHLAGF